MSPELCLTRSILISNNRVFENGLPRPFPFLQGSPLEFLDSLYKFLGITYPKYYKMDPLAKLGFLATELLLKEVPGGDLRPEDTGIVLSNASGSLEADRLYVRTIATGASPALFVYTLPNIVIGEIAIRHGFKGENAFFEFPAFDGKFIAGYVRILFEQSLVRRCICGWVDFLNNDYRALLMLVENNKPNERNAFTAELIDQLNNADHG